MRTIRVDDDVWSTLQKRAKAFEDTPNSVLRRVLGIDRTKSRRPAAPKVARGSKTAQAAFRRPLLRALYETGGAAKVSSVLDRVDALMSEQLNAADREALSSGGIRWRNTAQWERNVMVSEGLLKKSSPKGVWELTAKGITAAEADQH